MSNLTIMGILQSAKTPAHFQQNVLRAMQNGSLSPNDVHFDLMNLSKRLSKESANPIIQKQGYSLFLLLNDNFTEKELSLEQILGDFSKDMFNYVRNNKTKFSLFDTGSANTKKLRDVFKTDRTDYKPDKREEIRTLLQNGFKEMAIQKFKAWHKAVGDTKEILATSGDIYKEIGNFEKAIRVYLKANEIKNAQKLMEKYLDETEELNLYLEFGLRVEIKNLFNSYAQDTYGLLGFGDHLINLRQKNPRNKESLFAIAYLNDLLGNNASITPYALSGETESANIRFVEQYLIETDPSTLLTEMTLEEALQSSDLAQITKYANKLVGLKQYGDAIHIYVKILAQTNSSLNIPSQKLLDCLKQLREFYNDDGNFLNHVIRISQSFKENTLYSQVLFEYAYMVSPLPNLLILGDMAKNNTIVEQHQIPTMIPESIAPHISAKGFDPIKATRLAVDIFKAKTNENIETPAYIVDQSDLFRNNILAISSVAEFATDPVLLEAFAKVNLREKQYDSAIIHFSGAISRSKGEPRKLVDNLEQSIELLKNEHNDNERFVDSMLELFRKIVPYNKYQALLVLETANEVLPTQSFKNYIKVFEAPQPENTPN